MIIVYPSDASTYLAGHVCLGSKALSLLKYILRLQRAHNPLRLPFALLAVQPIAFVFLVNPRCVISLHTVEALYMNKDGPDEGSLVFLSICIDLG